MRSLTSWRKKIVVEIFLIFVNPSVLLGTFLIMNIFRTIFFIALTFSTTSFSARHWKKPEKPTTWVQQSDYHSEARLTQPSLLILWAGIFAILSSVGFYVSPKHFAWFEIVEPNVIGSLISVLRGRILIGGFGEMATAGGVMTDSISIPTIYENVFSFLLLVPIGGCLIIVGYLSNVLRICFAGFYSILFVVVITLTSLLTMESNKDISINLKGGFFLACLSLCCFLGFISESTPQSNKRRYY